MVKVLVVPYVRFLDEHVDEEHGGGSALPWGDVILGTLIVTAVAFTGLVFAVAIRCFAQPCKVKPGSILYRILIPSFATGAIFATATFLLIPESIHALMQATSEAAADKVGGDEAEDEDHHEDDHHDHDESFVWKFGACLTAGFLFPALVTFLFPNHRTVTRIDSPEPEIASANNKASLAQVRTDDNPVVDHLEGGSSLARSVGEEDEGDEEGSDVSGEKDINDIGTEQDGCTSTECNCQGQDDGELNKKNWALASTVLLGDAFCNFADGFFIGTAFMLCSKAVGYTLVATTVYHELAQELADYMILTKRCNFEPWRALLVNLLVGLTVVLGAILVLLLDMSKTAVGCILAISAGVYVFVCGVELLPRIRDDRKAAKEAVHFFVSFAAGAVPIGLVLLNHGHCEPGEEEDAHHDDGHRYY